MIVFCFVFYSSSFGRFSIKFDIEMLNIFLKFQEMKTLFNFIDGILIPIFWIFLRKMNFKNEPLIENDINFV